MQWTYWGLAGLLAAFYLFGGGKKLLQSKEALAPMMGWVDKVPMRGVRVIGVLEVLGAIGLLAPPLVEVWEWLALVALLCFSLLQILAGALHASRGEFKNVPMNVVLLVLQIVAAFLFIAYAS